MSIRELTRNTTVTQANTDKMVAIVFDGPDRWLCIWNVEGTEKQIPVSDALRADITNRPSFRMVLDAMRDDTHNRAIA